MAGSYRERLAKHAFLADRIHSIISLVGTGPGEADASSTSDNNTFEHESSAGVQPQRDGERSSPRMQGLHPHCRTELIGPKQEFCKLVANTHNKRTGMAHGRSQLSQPGMGVVERVIHLTHESLARR